MNQELDQLCINTLRFLSVDAVEKANSGHPGLPLGAASMAWVLWSRFLRHNPAHPEWPDRDRFVLSAGHGSALLYSLLHLTGYDVTLEDLKQFRQWGSKTPGHPERGETAGVEVTTGPLGQGFSNAVGMAIAEAQLAARYNHGEHKLVDHRTFVLASDGDLMEGVCNEAVSLAGDLRLGKLICLYDDNHITLAGGTGLVFTEDKDAHFAACGWQTLRVDDGNDLDAIDQAIRQACAEKLKPTLILVRSHIGYGSPMQDSHEAHGSPLGAEATAATKRNLGWPEEPAFLVPEEARARGHQIREHGAELEQDWQQRRLAFAKAHPDLARQFDTVIDGEIARDWDAELPEFPADAKGMASRKAGGKVIQAVAAAVPSLTGGSADLDPSTYTALDGCGQFHPGAPDHGDWSYAGRNIHFGVREHAMGAIANGLAAHGGMLPFTATFLTFSDYMRPSIRLAALMHLQAVFVFTHDSIALGEDGPTHQPVEQLAALRAIPRLVVIRPGDANEAAEAWRSAVEERDRPTALIFSRQNLPTLDRNRHAPAAGARRGAYVIAEAGNGQAELILIASGSELHLAMQSAEQLEQQGIATRVVSMPSWELFEAQSEDYRDSVLPAAVTARLAIEAGSSQGWWRYVGSAGDVLAVDRFGASAPGDEVMRRYGFTCDNVVSMATALLRR